MAVALAVFRLLFAIALAVLAHDWRAPTLASARPLLLAGLLAGSVLLIAAELWSVRRTPRRGIRRLGLVTIAIAALVCTAVLAREAHFRFVRHTVLNADPAQLEMLGRHFIVGYRSGEEIRTLIERRAIAGVFLTSRNVGTSTPAQIRERIDAWQDIRRRQGLPPLWIATDQEGGIVSRLSPPLPRRPPLSEVIAAHREPAAQMSAVAELARVQGRELAALGINLNFAPVVDLNHGIVNPGDRFTRIASRAISTDPDIVAATAGAYCAGLRESGVHCTLKHFPGLGRVFEDTHLDSADLDASPGELAKSDWIPFRALMRDHDRVVMLGHARLTALDRSTPASFSRPLIAGLLRGEWSYDGLLITDDFSMGAVYGADEGIAGASVAALNAGVDLILLSFDPDQYFLAMGRLLRAAHSGELDRTALDRSDFRLKRAAGN
jgi:beta-N-acetylhexosaminidase